MDLEKSLEQLEGDVWGEPLVASRLANKCHELRKQPISKLTVEDLRLLIGQKTGLRFLVPLALDVLESNPFAEGDMYKGDLLSNVLRVNDDFWSNHPELNNRLVNIGIEISGLAQTISAEILPAMSKFEYK